jgi:hypothetical protein
MANTELAVKMPLKVVHLGVWRSPRPNSIPKTASILNPIGVIRVYSTTLATPAQTEQKQ